MRLNFARVGVISHVRGSGMGCLQLKKSIALLLPFAFMGAFAGCGVHNGTATTSPTQPPPSQPPPVAGQSGSVTIDPEYVAISPGGSVHFRYVSSRGGQIQWEVNGVAGGSAATGTVDSAGNYTAPASISLSENVTVTAALASSPQQNYATA